MFLYNLVNKDIKYENEPKRVMVALRVMYISVFIAQITDLCIMGPQVLYDQRVRFLILFTLNVLLLIQTYYVRTSTSLLGYIAFTFIYYIIIII